MAHDGQRGLNGRIEFDGVPMTKLPSNSSVPSEPSTTSQSSAIMKMPEAIVFFDGVCGLCNGVVDFLLNIDQEHRLYFAPLQGKLAGQLLSGLVPADVLTETESIVFFKCGRAFLRSDAIIEILRALPGPWRFAALAYVIPRPARDAAYRFIATNRYRWFGKRATCRIPTREERPYFLD
jgi:predicted DCC family thiol-disulfide oxidoreductase YuxK